MTPTIIQEDNHLLVLNKPAGWLVQGDKTGDFTLTEWGKEYLKVKYEKPGAVYLNPAHRIDRPVSGAVIFGRTDKALGRLNTLFKEQKVAKTYMALSLEAPPAQEGILRHFLRKDEKRNTVEVFENSQPEAKESITQYVFVAQIGQLYLLKITPQTGRPHQIRAQLQAAGCPILGDVKYGAPHVLTDASIALHCRQMSFIHPVRQELQTVVADFPTSDWWKAVAALTDIG